MITLLEWHQQGGGTLALNSDIYPVRQFNPIPTYSGYKPLKKMQLPGSWPNFNYPEGMSLDIVGDILGTDTADYIVNRDAFMAGIHVPLAVQTVRRHGFLRVQYDGWGSAGDVDCHVTSVDSPMDTEYGWSVSEFRITLFAFTPELSNSERL